MRRADPRTCLSNIPGGRFPQTVRLSHRGGGGGRGGAGSGGSGGGDGDGAADVRGGSAAFVTTATAFMAATTIFTSQGQRLPGTLYGGYSYIWTRLHRTPLSPDAMPPSL